LVALGAVIRGETYHFEVVSDTSAAGVLQVQMQTGIPVANGILTVDTDAQAEARMHSKGGEAAGAAVEMAVLLRGLR
jgi:6,7-dimethyl-8-ribityllumazine synthase